MNEMWAEIAAILVLLAINGVLAMTEIAVVSSRKARLRQLADKGNASAKTALELAESPSRFLATVQIGITLVGILAGAFGGVTIAETIGRYLDALPWFAPYGESIGLGLVVMVITYFSLVIGELAPKRIGLGHPEAIAMLVAKPMRALAFVSGPAVRLLTGSTDALLRVLHVRPASEAMVTEDEVNVLMQEGLRSGAFNKVESKIVHSALELDELTLPHIMTPRLKITWLNQSDPHETVWHKIVVSGHSFFPVYKGSRDNVLGVVSVKAIYANLAAGLPARISDLMTDPLVVPATQTVLQLIDTYKRTGKHFALVADEFGGIEGLVTLSDVMQAILGDYLSLEERLKPTAKKRDDGTWLVDGMLSLQSAEDALTGFRFSDEDRKDFQTLAGFVMKQLRRVPNEGERFQAQGYTFEIIDMDKHRVDKILVTPIVPDPQPPTNVSF